MLFHFISNLCEFPFMLSDLGMLNGWPREFLFISYSHLVKMHKKPPSHTPWKIFRVSGILQRRRGSPFNYSTPGIRQQVFITHHKGAPWPPIRWYLLQKPGTVWACSSSEWYMGILLRFFFFFFCIDRFRKWSQAGGITKGGRNTTRPADSWGQSLRLCDYRFQVCSFFPASPCAWSFWDLLK